MATSNLFAPSVTPSQVCELNGNLIDLGGPLSPGGAFVQSLYNKLLGRTGTPAEIHGWLNVFDNQGQAPVANGILRSRESLGRIVDQLYLRFLGRNSDPGGRSNWVSVLENGATLEGVELGFLTSAEYINHINTDYVQSLYINLLGRTGEAAGLAFWNNNLQTLGLAGIANGFLTSAEFRADNVNADFQNLVHRPAFPSELNGFAALPTDLLGIEAAILSKPDYLNFA